jgi:tetratricopeptide (TPR) repeat protein
MAIQLISLIGPAINIARPALAEARSLWKRRGASPLDGTDPGSVDRELDSALVILSGQADNLPEWLVRQVAAVLSDRPQIFSEPAIREWLNHDEVCAVLKRAALESIANRDVDAEREFAALRYADLANDFAWYGAVAFDFALSYLLRTLDSKISIDARLIIETGNRNAQHLEAMLNMVLEHVDGLPIGVARSIVTEFGENGENRSAGELEEILRRKAIEYHALRDELATLRSEDSRVLALRDEALAAIDAGDFDSAYERLIEARRFDRESSREAERVRMQRRCSEAETVLSMARLAALRANYRDAYALSMEAREIAQDASRDITSRCLLVAAHYLNEDCHAIGTEGAIEANIREAEQSLLPLATVIDTETHLAVLMEIADLYALLGYREGSNPRLAQAAMRFRRIAREVPTSAEGRLRLRSAISLGDTHAEIGLNRNSIRQARVGLWIMQAALNDASLAVSTTERAKALIRLGTAQANAGLMVNGGSEFDDSVCSYEAAMALVEDLDEPVTHARAWWGFPSHWPGKGRRSAAFRSSPVQNSAATKL